MDLKLFKKENKQDLKISFKWANKGGVSVDVVVSNLGSQAQNDVIN